MAYTGGNAGYVRRLGKIPSTGGGTPTSPVDGYSAWFDADTNVFSDDAGTVPAVNGAEVRCWKPRVGSSVSSPFLSNSVNPSVYTLNTGLVNGKAGLEYDGTKLSVLQAVDYFLFANGVISVGGFTVFYALNFTATDALSIPIWSGNNKLGISVDPNTGGFGFGMRSYIYNSIGGYVLHSSAAGVVSTPSTEVFCSQYNGSNWDAYRSTLGFTDVARVERSTLTGTLAEGATALIGTYGAAGTDILSFIFYPTSLNEADRVITGTYMKNYYGL